MGVVGGDLQAFIDIPPCFFILKPADFAGCQPPIGISDTINAFPCGGISRIQTQGFLEIKIGATRTGSASDTGVCVFFGFSEKRSQIMEATTTTVTVKLIVVSRQFDR